jgi:hypothetical protein
MKWFDRWFARKCKWAWENRDEVMLDPSTNITKARAIPQDIELEQTGWEDGLRITIKKMIGGSVVSFRTYDRRTDRSESRHYIITDDEDFTTELGKIITMESMRQT